MLVAQREYSYDTLGRPTARNTARQGTVVNDIFEHNTRSELVIATVNGKNYEYAYDNIGNREFSLEDGKATMYDANSLNQYTSIAVNGGAPFIPQFDADGNQTLIKTETGIWSAVYNAENRPCIAAPHLRNKPWINEKLSANLASHLPPIGKPSAEGLPAT